jgi:Flp pilus assembly protein TadD
MIRYRFNGMPLESAFWLGRGRNLAGKGNDSAALKYFRQAAFIAPASSNAFRETAECLKRLGRYEEAHVYYQCH